MNLLEIADLTELLRKRLNIEAPGPGAYMPGAPAAAGLPPACMQPSSLSRQRGRALF